MMAGMELLRAGLQNLGLDLSETQSAQFARYQELLQEWNQRFNLTAVRSPEGIETTLFLNSLTCAVATGDLSGQRLVDVGTGAGFPGLPLKILCPALDLTLVDSAGKKAEFLRQVVADLGLTHVEVLVARAEELGQDPAQRESYDWAVARAVAPLAVLVEYLLPLCRLGGTALAQKGIQVESEVASAQAAITILGGGGPTVIPVQLPQEESSYLVTIKKELPTPSDYPRRIGVPSKRPL
jgi:16S rRNA (guanine527-N7)-methyltransferase